MRINRTTTTPPPPRLSFDPDSVRIVPNHCARYWQSCDYWHGRTHLFHERTFMRSPPPGQRGPLTPAQAFALCQGSDRCEQWFSGGLTEAEAREVCARHVALGLTYQEEHYPDDDAAPFFFLVANDTNNALAFCQTDDFATHCATMEKRA